LGYFGRKINISCTKTTGREEHPDWLADGSQFGLVVLLVICEKALLDIGPEKNGTIEPSFRGTDLSNALISVKYSPFGPQNRDFGRKTTEREKPRLRGGGN